MIEDLWSIDRTTIIIFVHNAAQFVTIGSSPGFRSGKPNLSQCRHVTIILHHPAMFESPSDSGKLTEALVCK